MTEYRKKPLVIEAIQIPRNEGDDQSPLQKWCKEHAFGLVNLLPTAEILVHTLEGSAVGKPGDWLIKGVKDEIYPCADEVFRATYEGADVPSKEQFALRRLKDLCENTVDTLRDYIVPDGETGFHTLNNLIGLFDCTEYSATKKALDDALATGE